MIYLIDPNQLTLRPPCKTNCATYCGTKCKPVYQPLYGIDPWI